MQKIVKYKGEEYTIEIKWSGSSYCVREINVSGYVIIPMNCLDDINKIKPFII